jgi:hypothetical protein
VTALLGRDGFDRMLAAALAERRGFAAGKLGNSEVGWLRLPLVEEREPDPRRRRAHALVVSHRSRFHAGIFPATPEFQSRFADEFARAAGELDAIGVFPKLAGESAELLAAHGMRGAPMDFSDQEPERSVPADEERCWLRHLRGRRVLIVAPFAKLLRARANHADYEAAWAKIGKRWFEPESVAAVELPYGFDPEVHRRYDTALDLLSEVRERVLAEEFDVALIAAGGLAIPLAAAIKRDGRAGLSLGGHLQVMFGVTGERWLEREDWRRAYFNETWVRVPERYRPVGATMENYW